MKKKTILIMILVLTMTLMLGNAVFAFQDLQNDPAQSKIEALQQQGIVNGMDADHFDPKGAVTYAQGVQLIVKGLKLNIDNIQFIKAPKASDYFSHVSDDAWYAKSFIIAAHNGLTIGKDVNPNAVMTKEVFAQLLFQGLTHKGEFAIIDLWINIADEQNVTKDYMSSIQKLLILKIAALDKDNQFHPKSEISRSEATEMIYNTIEFLKTHDVTPVPTSVPNDITMNTAKISPDVNKVTLAWGEKPNNCYGISIVKIEFSQDEAIIYYNLKTPQPDMMCGQIITHPQAETYISSSYTIRLEPAA
ncbi:MAG: S-layer protein [Bacilli bacterium]|nr:S-layer protein [Bacilli bacterium]